MSFFLFLADVSVPTHVFFLCGKKGIAVIMFDVSLFLRKQDSVPPRQDDFGDGWNWWAEGIFGGWDPFSQG